MCHLVVEGCLHLGGEKFLARIVVVWVVKVDWVPLLVEYVTVLEVVGGVLVKDVMAHIVVEGVLVELMVSCIVVVAMGLVAFLVVVIEPCEEFKMMDVVFVMVLVKFVVHVFVVKVLEESIAA